MFGSFIACNGYSIFTLCVTVRDQLYLFSYWLFSFCMAGFLSPVPLLQRTGKGQGKQREETRQKAGPNLRPCKYP